MAEVAKRRGKGNGQKNCHATNDKRPIWSDHKNRQKGERPTLFYFLFFMLFIKTPGEIKKKKKKHNLTMELNVVTSLQLFPKCYAGSAEHFYLRFQIEFKNFPFLGGGGFEFEFVV